MELGLALYVETEIEQYRSGWATTSRIEAPLYVNVFSNFKLTEVTEIIYKLIPPCQQKNNSLPNGPL